MKKVVVFRSWDKFISEAKKVLSDYFFFFFQSHIWGSPKKTYV